MSANANATREIDVPFYLLKDRRVVNFSTLRSKPPKVNVSVQDGRILVEDSEIARVPFSEFVAGHRIRNSADLAKCIRDNTTFFPGAHFFQRVFSLRGDNVQPILEKGRHVALGCLVEMYIPIWQDPFASVKEVKKSAFEVLRRFFGLVPRAPVESVQSLVKTRLVGYPTVDVDDDGCHRGFISTDFMDHLPDAEKTKLFFFQVNVRSS
jgi:hypothetical protein